MDNQKEEKKVTPKTEKPSKETKKEKKVEVKKKEEVKAEAKKPAKKAEPELPAEKAAEAPPTSKNKKINKMTAAEIEAKLEEVKTTMGGLKSKYAQQLLRRKNLLSVGP